MSLLASSRTLAVPISPSPQKNVNVGSKLVSCILAKNGFSGFRVPVESAAERWKYRLNTSINCRRKPCSWKGFRLLGKENSSIQIFCPYGPWHYLQQTPCNPQSVQTVRTSFDDEFRSSQSVALGLFKRYKSVVEGGFTENLRDFIDAGVTAYAVGCTDEGLRKELLNIGSSAGELEGNTGSSSSVGLQSKLTAEEVEECILWTSILFITILCTPQPTVVRWSSTLPVSAEVQVQWRGFCALIANAYYVRGMAWLPVKTLQMEQMAVAGYAEEPSLVADRMRLVFGTLEVVSPQWPKRSVQPKSFQSLDPLRNVSDSEYNGSRLL